MITTMKLHGRQDTLNSDVVVSYRHRAAYQDSPPVFTQARSNIRLTPFQFHFPHNVQVRIQNTSSRTIIIVMLNAFLYEPTNIRKTTRIYGTSTLLGT